MGWYLVITQEMVDDLRLQGNELMVYALINGYSQNGQGSFHGSISYISKVCGIARRTVINILQSLCDRRLIEKTTTIMNGIKIVTYKVATASRQDTEKCTGGAENAQGVVQNLHPIINSNNIKEISIQSTNVDSIDTKKDADALSPTTPSSRFPFKKSLIALGISEEVAEAWMAVRRSKRATNSRIAFEGIKREIEKSGHTAEECARMAVENSWQGFRAEWMLRDKIPKAMPQKSTSQQLDEVAAELNQRYAEIAARKRAEKQTEKQNDGHDLTFQDILGR